MISSTDLNSNVNINDDDKFEKISNKTTTTTTTRTLPIISTCRSISPLSCTSSSSSSSNVIEISLTDDASKCHNNNDENNKSIVNDNDDKQEIVENDNNEQIIINNKNQQNNHKENNIQKINEQTYQLDDDHHYNNNEDNDCIDETLLPPLNDDDLIELQKEIAAHKEQQQRPLPGTRRHRRKNRFNINSLIIETQLRRSMTEHYLSSSSSSSASSSSSSSSLETNQTMITTKNSSLPLTTTLTSTQTTTTTTTTTNTTTTTASSSNVSTSITAATIEKILESTLPSISIIQEATTKVSAVTLKHLLKKAPTVKRGRGRPRKYQPPKLSSSIIQQQQQQSSSSITIDDSMGDSISLNSNKSTNDASGDEDNNNGSKNIVEHSSNDNDDVNTTIIVDQQQQQNSNDNNEQTSSSKETETTTLMTINNNETLPPTSLEQQQQSLNEPQTVRRRQRKQQICLRKSPPSSPIHLEEEEEEKKQSEINLNDEKIDNIDSNENDTNIVKIMKRARKKSMKNNNEHDGISLLQKTSDNNKNKTRYVKQNLKNNSRNHQSIVVTANQKPMSIDNKRNGQWQRLTPVSQLLLDQMPNSDSSSDSDTQHQSSSNEETTVMKKQLQQTNKEPPPSSSTTATMVVDSMNKSSTNNQQTSKKEKQLPIQNRYRKRLARLKKRAESLAATNMVVSNHSPSSSSNVINTDDNNSDSEMINLNDKNDECDKIIPEIPSSSHDVLTPVKTKRLKKSKNLLPSSSLAMNTNDDHQSVDEIIEFVVDKYCQNNHRRKQQQNDDDNVVNKNVLNHMINKKTKSLKTSISDGSTKSLLLEINDDSSDDDGDYEPVKVKKIKSKKMIMKTKNKQKLKKKKSIEKSSEHSKREDLEMNRTVNLFSDSMRRKLSLKNNGHIQQQQQPNSESLNLLNERRIIGPIIRIIRDKLLNNKMNDNGKKSKKSKCKHSDPIEDDDLYTRILLDSRLQYHLINKIDELPSTTANQTMNNQLMNASAATNATSSVSSYLRSSAGRLRKLKQNLIDAQTEDRVDDWCCIFCQQRPNVNNLGYLYGPYYFDDDFGIMINNNGDRRTIFNAKIEIWFHEQCYLWTNIPMATPYRPINSHSLTIINEALKSCCYYCNQIGATIACLMNQCDRHYHHNHFYRHHRMDQYYFQNMAIVPMLLHYPCAIELNYQFDDNNFTVYCPDHQQR
ncbi:uncharacterized protein LOC124493752 isoform X3 [Dermatophagoides farinae]|uniref:uncharacterized protein LOC124493752 isoform X3 n=1 Tax=Dermatophagoides farinae TaxID=6954 RepID=UPI003F62C47A